MILEAAFAQKYILTQLKIVGTLLLTLEEDSLEEDSWSIPDLGCVVQLNITKNHMLERLLTSLDDGGGA